MCIRATGSAGLGISIADMYTEGTDGYFNLGVTNEI